jgi:hypothetical protein
VYDYERVKAKKSSSGVSGWVVVDAALAACYQRERKPCKAGLPG